MAGTETSPDAADGQTYEQAHRRPPLPMPENAPPGPFRRSFWKSPLRGPWMASILSSALGPLVIASAITGLVSQAAYDPALGTNAFIRGPDVNLYFFSWPTDPSWLYAVTQGIHVTAGMAAIPILLAKLWAVIPKLFEWPPVRSVAHGIERATLALLVGGGIFTFVTGVLNIQLFYPWGFSFITAHYYGSLVFLGALIFHIIIKLPLLLRAHRDRGLTLLRQGLAETEPEQAPDHEAVLAGQTDDSSAPTDPAPPTISRRGLLATVGAGSLGLAFITFAQQVGGPLRSLALLAPHNAVGGSGPNAFQINKTAMSVGVSAKDADPKTYALTLKAGDKQVSLNLDDLRGMTQHTESLPIACVEGWSTTQSWTGVRLADLARMAGVPEPSSVLVESIQKRGSFAQATLSRGKVTDTRSLLALQVNGADLSLDHGFPARVIVPALPGVHATKWVNSMEFKA